MNLRDRARFAHVAAPLVREHNGIRLGLSDRVTRIIAEAEDTDEFVVQRCRQSGYHVESSIVQQETVAVQWVEGFRFYQPHKRLFLLWILHGFFRSVVRDDMFTLTDLKSMQLRASDLGLGISRKAISSYVRDASMRKGWWELRDNDQDARVRQIVPSARLAFMAHLSHLCALAQSYALARPRRDKFTRNQWQRMGYPEEKLEELAIFIRNNRSKPESHV